MKKALPYIIAVFAVSPFALQASAQQHDVHHHTPNTALNSAENTKQLRANTTDKYGNPAGHNDSYKMNKDKRVGMKPLKPADRKDMLNREKVASPPGEDISDQTDIK